MEVVGEHLSSIMELLEANVTSDQQQLASAEMEAAEQRQVGQLPKNLSVCMSLPSQHDCLGQSPIWTPGQCGGLPSFTCA